MDLKQLYYVRRGEEIRGPYPLGLVQRHILIGRIVDSDELSTDRQEWRAVTEYPGVLPEVLRADDSEDVHKRLERARRWADERSGVDRRAHQDAAEAALWKERRRGERRTPEPQQVIQARLQRSQRLNEGRGQRENTFTVKIAVLGLLMVVVAYLLLYQPVPESEGANCNASARPQINWNYCQLEGVSLYQADLHGAQLRNVNFSGASLRGSNLRGADLSFAVLSIANLSSAYLSNAILVGASFRNADLGQASLDGADLSYADLSGANLSGASLQGAVLDHAIWINHRHCLVGSVGGCLQKTSPE